MRLPFIFVACLIKNASPEIIDDRTTTSAKGNRNCPKIQKNTKRKTHTHTHKKTLRRQKRRTKILSTLSSKIIEGNVIIRIFGCSAICNTTPVQFTAFFDCLFGCRSAELGARTKSSTSTKCRLCRL